MAKKEIAKETYGYKGWLISDSFMKRAFACLGYQLVAGLMIYGVILGVMLVFVIIFGLFAGLASLFS